MNHSLFTIVLLCALVIMACSPNFSQGKQEFNLDMEKLDSNFKPKSWVNGFNDQLAMSCSMTPDSVIRHGGKYSIQYTKNKTNIEKINDQDDDHVIYLLIPCAWVGKTISLSGFIRTKDVSGYAGLWMKLTGENGLMGLDLMRGHGLSGTNEWKKLEITMPLPEGVETIVVGLILKGNGTAWLDDLSVQIDNTDISFAAKRKKNWGDTILGNGVNMKIAINEQTVDALDALGQIWGFMKYQHPSVVSGKYDWDAELISVLPQIASAKNKHEWLSVIENWMERFSTEKPPFKERKQVLSK